MKASTFLVAGLGCLFIACMGVEVQATRQLLTPGTCSKTHRTCMFLFWFPIRTRHSRKILTRSPTVFLWLHQPRSDSEHKSWKRGSGCFLLAGCTTILPPGPVCDVFCGKAFPVPGQQGNGCSCQASCNNERYECTKQGPNAGCSCYCSGGLPQIMGGGECHRLY